MIVAGDLNFGGPGTLPQGRIDTSYVLTDTFSHARGRHSIKLGGEYRHFINENFAEGTGSFNFPSVDAFLAGTANAFSITLGERRSLIDQRAAGAVRPGPDRHRRQPHDRSRPSLRVARDADRAGRSVRRVRRGERARWCASASDVDEIYQQNNRNVEPRARRRVEPLARRPHGPARRLRRGRSISRARRRSGTPRAIRRSRCR